MEVTDNADDASHAANGHRERDELLRRPAPVHPADRASSDGADDDQADLEEGARTHVRSNDKSTPNLSTKDGEKDKDGAKDGKSQDDGEKDEKKSPPWSTTKKLIVFGTIGLILLIAIISTALWWMHARHFEKTDDAFIDAHYEKVAPQVAGRVLRVNVDDNQIVQPGDVLFEIDPRDYQAAVEQANGALAEAQSSIAQAEAQREVALANVEQAKADVENAQATLDNANSQLERYQGLSREALSPQRLDDLKTAQRNASAQLAAATKRQSAQGSQVLLAESQIKAAQAQVKSAQARVETATLNLSYTAVKASAGGRVTNRMVQTGDYVQPGQQALVLVPTDVYVTANFKETQLADMRPGQPVMIAVDAFPDEEFRGHVDSFQAGAGQVFSLLPPENATGNYVKVVQRVPVKIVFDDKNNDAYKRLGPGMSVGPSVRVR